MSHLTLNQHDQEPMKRLLKATLCLLLLCAAPLRGEYLPDIPSSAAVLTLDDVKNYWINTALSAPLTPEGSSFQTAQNAARAQSIAARQSLIQRVRCGALDTEARLVQRSCESQQILFTLRS